MCAGVNETMIAATLQRCCSDVLRLLATPSKKGVNELGFSETIHLRHLAAGRIPVALAYFPVLLTRLQVGCVSPLPTSRSPLSCTIRYDDAGSAERWLTHLQSRVRPPVLQREGVLLPCRSERLSELPGPGLAGFSIPVALHERSGSMCTGLSLSLYYNVMYEPSRWLASF